MNDKDENPCEENNASLDELIREKNCFLIISIGSTTFPLLFDIFLPYLSTINGVMWIFLKGTCFTVNLLNIIILAIQKNTISKPLTIILVG